MSGQEDLDTMESVAGTTLNKKCDPKKNGVSGLLTKHLQKALHLSSPVTLSQHCTGSCPNLTMSRNDVFEPKMSRETVAGTRKTHRILCSSLSSDGIRRHIGPVSQGNLDAQMQAKIGGATSSRTSLEWVSRFCFSASSPLCKSTPPKPVESQSKPSSVQPSLFFPLLRHNSADSSLISVSVSKKGQQGSFQPEAARDAEPGGTQGFSFLEPIISRVIDCIYVGNLSAAYSGRVLCKNKIDSIIDMSNMSKDCRLSVIPCTCSRGAQHSWSRLKVHIQEPLQEDGLSLQPPPCFWDINVCIEASLEKKKRVLIHCRDGYSLAPTCVIQYLMVKHHMRLLDAYEFVRVKYPLNLQEHHRNLLVHLEKSLWPGEVDTECFKQAISRRMAWT